MLYNGSVAERHNALDTKVAQCKAGAVAAGQRNSRASVAGSEAMLPSGHNRLTMLPSGTATRYSQTGHVAARHNALDAMQKQAVLPLDNRTRVHQLPVNWRRCQTVTFFIFQIR